MQGHGIPVTVATYMGMNALHAACGLGRLPESFLLNPEINTMVVNLK